MREFLLEAVTLAALGTVADVVPLVGENRALVRHGLEGLNHLNRSGDETVRQIGLKALLQAASLSNNPTLRSTDVAFSLAPRLNAAGRLGQARLAVELLTTTSADRAGKLAGYLNEQNILRQTVEQRVFKEARKQVEAAGADSPAFVVADASWHAGVIGVVAGRLAERYHRPVFVLTQSGELAQGSGRSVPGLDLHAALEASREHLESYGGHEAAAGLKMRLDAIGAFREQFCQFVAANASPEHAEPVLRIDAEIPFSALTRGAILQLDHLEPFGAGNPKPIFCASGVELAAPPKRIGGGERHLALRVRQNGATLRAVAFGKGERGGELENAGAPFDVAFCPSLNTFRGFSNVELEVKDWRIDGAANA
jgi:single-stranded-DNA-specific exonuclease